MVRMVLKQTENAMSLRAKIVLMVTAVVVLFGVVDYAIQHAVVYPQFVSLERIEACKDLERCVEAIYREMAALNTICEDYASWNDTYEFVVTRDPDYVKSNLSLTNIGDLGVNAVYVCNTMGEVVWAGALDLETKQWVASRFYPEDGFPASHPLVARKTPEDRLSGLVATDTGPMLIVSQPVLKDESEGPVRGTFIMGKSLNSAAQEALKGQTRVDLRFGACLPASESPPVESVTGETLSHGDIAVNDQEEGVLRVSTVLADIYGRPILPIEVVIPRDITASGRAALGFATLSVGVAALVVIGTLLVLLQRVVVSPLSRLTRHAINIGRSDDLSARFNSDRKDEIGLLSRAFDSMVARLAEARKSLLDRSYRSGLAEMASGVLHNVRNALTPVLGEVEALREELARTPLDQIEIARQELSAGSVDESRREDLSRFLDLANGRLTAVARETNTKLESLVGRTRQIEQFLTDQECASRAERPIEAVDIGGIVQEAVSLVSSELRQCVSFAASSTLAAPGQLTVHRICLLQILVNLLNNGAESIQRGGKGRGHIRVCWDTELREGTEIVHIRVEDDGEGIAPENLQRVFERGFTTKQGSSGVGLHWCANTVADMKGRIYAESEGPGRGACLHLLLPRD